MTTPSRVVLDRLTAAAEDGWRILCDLAEEDGESWLLVGGQMLYLLAIENGQAPIRATDDVDVAVDVRARPGATEWLTEWLVDRGFELDPISADGIGHRLTRSADPGPGTVVVDILAPDGVGQRTSLFTRRPARTVRAPGTTQAFSRSELAEVSVSGDTGRDPRTGRVRRPNVLGALIMKAATTALAVRENPERDYEDAALLLSLITDPITDRESCSNSDLRNLRRIAELSDERHAAWRRLDSRAARRGRDSLGFFLD